MVNLYKLLGIDQSADVSEIKQVIAFYVQTKTLPEEILKQCRETLINPNTRSLYDDQLAAASPEEQLKISQDTHLMIKNRIQAVEARSAQMKHAATEEESRKKIPLWLRFILYPAIILFAAVIFILWQEYGGGSSKISGASFNADKALRLCKEDVKKQLKAPSSAKFESTPEVFFNNSTGKFSVTGTVDAQNSFGAMLRSGFICGGIYAGGEYTSINTSMVK